MENNFKDVMSKRTDEELIKIITVDRDNFQPLAVQAAEEEIKIREIESSKIEEIKNILTLQYAKQEQLDSTIVGSGTRFIHFLVDTFAVFVLTFIFILFLGIFFHDSGLDSVPFFGYLILLSSFFSYYILLENKYQKTIGKFITKTKVVTKNGHKAELSDIVIRTVYRLVPFDRMSFLFTPNGFHDYLSKTIVVKEKLVE
jgi:uncharacterized RDD family membrane protein YckC